MRPGAPAGAGPARPRILFVGLGESSHTVSWIDLLRGREFEARLFALPTGAPPPDWDVLTYVTSRLPRPPDATSGGPRRYLYPSRRAAQLPLRAVERLVMRDDHYLASRWLGRVVRRWRPHVIHTFGIEPASLFYMGARRAHRLAGIGRWVVQIRGGPDLALHRLLPERRGAIQEVLAGCDQVLADNRLNYRYAVEMGCDAAKLSPLGPVPGSGGVDVQKCRGCRPAPASESRTIVWPKAYDCPQSKSGPVLEALRLAMARIAPCRVLMLAMDAETRMWFETLPPEIRAHCEPAGRIPHRQALDLLAGARVMLAPTVADGIPNTLLEAMAYGVLPIVSPLPTLEGLVEDGRHALLARNLYPGEIAEALVRAMSDDPLVERAARENLELVGRIGDRAVIGAKVAGYYREQASAATEGR